MFGPEMVADDPTNWTGHKLFSVFLELLWSDDRTKMSQQNATFGKSRDVKARSFYRWEEKTYEIPWLPTVFLLSVCWRILLNSIYIHALLVLFANYVRTRILIKSFDQKKCKEILDEGWRWFYHLYLIVNAANRLLFDKSTTDAAEWMGEFFKQRVSFFFFF